MDTYKSVIAASIVTLSIVGSFAMGANFGNAQGNLLVTSSNGVGHTPVTICHNGNTITVDDSSILTAHLAHGDYIGACHSDEAPGKSGEAPGQNKIVVDDPNPDECSLIDSRVCY